MSKLGVQDPITAGQLVGAYNASAVNDTDWHTLAVTDFYDSTDGAQVAIGAKFSFIGAVSSNTTSVSFIKLRAAAGAGDGTANSDGVIPLLRDYSIDSAALQSGETVTSIAYKKAAGADSFIIYAGFNK